MFSATGRVFKSEGAVWRFRMSLSGSRLHRDGLIDEAEFRVAKRSVLEGSSGSSGGQVPARAVQEDVPSGALAGEAGVAEDVPAAPLQDADLTNETVERATISTKPERGWYPDPVDARRERFWNVDTWTSRTRRAGQFGETHIAAPKPHPPAPDPAARRPDTTHVSDAGRHATQARLTSEGPRYVGDAAVGEYWSVRQLLDAAAYVVAGIALIVMAMQPDVDSAWLPLIGLASMLYGAKIAIAGGSYWVSSWVYAIAGIAVLVALGSLG